MATDDKMLAELAEDYREKNAHLQYLVDVMDDIRKQVSDAREKVMDAQTKIDRYVAALLRSDY